MTIEGSNLADALVRAKGYHRAGDLQRAEALYRQIVAAGSADAEVYYLLGALCQTVRQPAEAATHLRQAVATSATSC